MDYCNGEWLCPCQDCTEALADDMESYLQKVDSMQEPLSTEAPPGWRGRRMERDEDEREFRLNRK